MFDDCWLCNGGLDLVIQGGESGPKARPFDIAWARDVRDECEAAGVSYFLKQLGRRPFHEGREFAVPNAPYHKGWLNLTDGHGGDMAEWPSYLLTGRERQWPGLGR